MGYLNHREVDEMGDQGWEVGRGGGFKIRVLIERELLLGIGLTFFTFPYFRTFKFRLER